MHMPPLRVLPPLALLAALCACSAGTSPERTGQEQVAPAQPAAAPATTPPTDDSASAPAPAPACDASRVQGLVGQGVDDAKAEQARLDAGAERVRLLKPGQMVTMEFDDARLSIETDDTGTITALRCG